MVRKASGRGVMAVVLVLDDVTDAVLLVKRLVQGMGHQVVGFTEEEEAISYMNSHSVDLAIIDVKLKRMNGLDVLEEMKRVAPGLRVIMLTGYPTLDSAQEAYRLGASDYCVKPVDIDELEEKVERALRR